MAAGVSTNGSDGNTLHFGPCPKCSGFIHIQHPAPGIWALTRDNLECSACELAFTRLTRAYANDWN